jgi:hypothetical protein
MEQIAPQIQVASEVDLIAAATCTLELQRLASERSGHSKPHQMAPLPRGLAVKRVVAPAVESEYEWELHGIKRIMIKHHKFFSRWCVSEREG